jgi:hypothetical protein
MAFRRSWVRFPSAPPLKTTTTYIKLKRDRLNFVQAVSFFVRAIIPVKSSHCIDCFQTTKMGVKHSLWGSSWSDAEKQRLVVLMAYDSIFDVPNLCPHQGSVEIPHPAHFL